MSTKGLIFNIQRFSVNDGPGIRTTVFMKGCPLGCWWCHNPESRSGKIEIIGEEEIGSFYTVEELMETLLKDRVFYEESDGGVTFSGGEPLQQPEFLTEALIACRDDGIHTAVDTTGFSDTKIIKEISGITDLFLYDLKIIDPENHKIFTTVSNEKILNNLELLMNQSTDIIIRIPLIAGITATEDNLNKIATRLNRFENKPEINLLPYHKIADHKYIKYGLENKMKGKQELTSAQISEIENFFGQAGFKVKIGG